MQAVFESLFNIFYLVAVLTLGIYMYRNAKGDVFVRRYGLMAIVLGAGDAFHLVPRIYAHFTTGFEANAAALGIGKLITSITMTLFYLLLYALYKMRYRVKKPKLDVLMGLLALARIGLCLAPQNRWTLYNAPVSWGIYRNIPFLFMGLIVLYLFYTTAKQRQDTAFSKMWLAVALSFGFYIPVVLWARTYPLVGMLMIPKTVAYLWIVYMGYRYSRNKASA
ncbi:hypothetical protein ACR6HW_02830 [Fusibacter sp. JL298sf-3]